MENIVNVVTVCSGGLKKGTAEFSSQRQSLFLGDLSQLLQVRLVSHKNHWCVIRASDAVNKLFKLPNFVETSTIRDGVTDDKPFSCSHVLIPHGCELGLSSCIQNVQIGRLIIDANPDLISVFNGGVMVFWESVADELHCHGTLPNATSTQHH